MNAGMNALIDLGNRIWQRQRPLALVTLGAAALLVASGLLACLDGRQVAGAPVWLKPAKFALAILTTAPTLAWILEEMRGAAPRRLRAAGTVVATVAALELALITLQAARGVRSHFNHATTFDSVVFTTMGIAITLLWLAELFITVRAFRWSFPTPARTWGIRLGLAGTLAGGAVGFWMPHPSPDQLASLRAGRPTPVVGAHAVGVPDGGPGLPLAGWSTTGGDLRVPHFLGLHALQGLPLLALFVDRRRRSSGQVVLGAGVAWLGLVGVTLTQALRGQPLLAPDGLTAATALAVLGLGLVIGRRAAPRPAILTTCAWTPAGSSPR
ncbi:MAG TPA: hypothetical protein VN962_09035 [Polyangia bacterium]|nr:hypothetical protein [Polyangia bacterium]